MDALTALQTRRSVRAYQSTPVAHEHLEQIFACGALAPSGCNQQPYMFVAVQKEETRKALASLCRYGGFLAQAPVAVAVFCNPAAITPFADACAAVQAMMTAAVALGYGTCWVNSHRLPHCKEVERLLNCPPELELAALFSLGKPEGQPRAPRKKPLAEIVRYESF